MQFCISLEKKSLEHDLVNYHPPPGLHGSVERAQYIRRGDLVVPNTNYLSVREFVVEMALIILLKKKKKIISFLARSRESITAVRSVGCFQCRDSQDAGDSDAV